MVHVTARNGALIIYRRRGAYQEVTTAEVNKRVETKLKHTVLGYFSGEDLVHICGFTGKSGSQDPTV